MADTLKLHFTKPGLHTTVQDAGRNGHQHLGIPVNGFMDHRSACEANRLVENDENGPLIEITMIGPEIRFEGAGQIAITGADLHPKINGKPIHPYAAIQVRDGDLLQFGTLQQGCRAYLAVHGHWKVQSWLGSQSASTVQPEALTPDSLIKKGSQITVVSERPAAENISDEYYYDMPDLQDDGVLNVIPGPEFSLLSNITIASFFSQVFTISSDSNRMGYRLEGSVRGFSPLKEVISSGIIPGTIQLTNSGQPIVLMADAQTSGGYTRIANLSRDSMDQLAQMKPGEQVRFVLARFAPIKMRCFTSDLRSDAKRKGNTRMAFP